MTYPSIPERTGLIAPILNREEMRDHTRILLTTLAIITACLAIGVLISSAV